MITTCYRMRDEVCLLLFSGKNEDVPRIGEMKMLVSFWISHFFSVLPPKITFPHFFGAHDKRMKGKVDNNYFWGILWQTERAIRKGESQM